MEYGSFQNLRLSQLNFDGETDNEIKSESKTEFRNLEHKRPFTSTSSFDALMSQNEDLTARLKVALRRLTEVESQTQGLSDENDDLRASYIAMQDQILIYKEKDKMWKEKETLFEENLRKAQWQSKIDQDSLKEKCSDFASAKGEIERFKRYHEKIQKVVKPYIQQLKDFSASLTNDNQVLRAENEFLQSRIRILENKISGIQNDHTAECESLVFEKNQLMDIFEKERSALKSDIAAQNNDIIELRIAASKLERYQERNDELENLVVVLRRTKEEMEKSFSQESASTREALILSKNLARELELKLDDSKNSNDRLNRDISNLSSQLVSNNEQMTSLRYLWTQKAEENEKLKASVEALEKLNIDLSEKLNQLRSL